MSNHLIKELGEKVLIRGISILVCEDCLKDYPAPSDFDVVVKLCKNC